VCRSCSHCLALIATMRESLVSRSQDYDDGSRLIKHLWACLPLIDWEAIGLGSFSGFLSRIYGRVYNCRVACDPETLSSGHGGCSRRSRHLAKPEKKVSRWTLIRLVHLNLVSQIYERRSGCNCCRQYNLITRTVFTRLWPKICHRSCRFSTPNGIDE
jgi:hypothetical protein